MKKCMILCLVGGFFMACSKQGCIGRAEDGTELFEVKSSAKCEAQINAENGEYCICGK